MHFSKWSKSSKSYILHDHLYMAFRKEQSYRDKELTSVCQGLRERGVFDYKGAAYIKKFI